MINADPATGRTEDAENAAVERIVGTGANGAKMLAGVATAVVVGLWLAFYFYVFVPRSAPP
jgi:hypothetical protein